MITADQLDQVEYAMKHGRQIFVDLQFITDVRALMAENVELYSALDKTKKAVSDATQMLDEVLK